jgi:hypothetical protein
MAKCGCFGQRKDIGGLLIDKSQNKENKGPLRIKFSDKIRSDMYKIEKLRRDDDKIILKT